MITDLFVRSGSDIDLLEESSKNAIKEWIEKLDIDVLIIDPIGDAWSGDENKKEEVSKVTSFLNYLREKYEISILVVHHWRKSSKHSKRGPEMASGSYKWNAWLDTHITLEGADIKSVVLSCEKSRNTPKFAPFIVGVDSESLKFEFKKDFSNKFDSSTLEYIYEQFNQEWVKITELCKYAKENKVCSEDTVRKLIKESKTFDIDTSQKAHSICRKQVQEDFLDECSSWDA